MKKAAMSLRGMIYASLFGAGTAAGAYIIIPLPPVPITLQGHLQVNVNAKSNVKVDGENQGTASPGHPLNLQNLQKGNVTVLVEADGYAPQERTVAINGNEWTQEVFTLKREPGVIMAEPRKDNGRALSTPHKEKTYPVSGRFSTRMARDAKLIRDIRWKRL